MFPTHLLICVGPPQHQHRPPHIDFLFLELRPVLTHSLKTSAAISEQHMYSDTVDGSVVFSMLVKPTKKRRRTN